MYYPTCNYLIVCLCECLRNQILYSLPDLLIGFTTMLLLYGCLNIIDLYEFIQPGEALVQSHDIVVLI